LGESGRRLGEKWEKLGVQIIGFSMELSRKSGIHISCGFGSCGLRLADPYGTNAI
jgi:hypothetical protein